MAYPVEKNEIIKFFCDLHTVWWFVKNISDDYTDDYYEYAARKVFKK